MIEFAVAVLSGGAVFVLARPRLTFLDISSARSVVPTRTKHLGSVRADLQKLLGSIGRSSPFQHRHLTALLASSGNEAESSDAYRGASLTMAAVGAVVGLALGPMALFASPALGALGYRLPAFWLHKKSRARVASISEGLPDALDLLVVCLSAGLNLSLALERVAARTLGPLGHELERVQRLVSLGLPRRQALAELEARTDSAEVAALVSALLTTDRFGSSVAGSLEALASDLRAKRRRSAEEQARKAPVKMLFPLVFLILPAFILLTIVPLLLGTFRSLGL